MIKHFREEGGVTLQTMFGVLCLYLLVGLLFGVGFVAIQEPLGRALLHHGRWSAG